jgi:hypothetical protein
MQLYTPLFIIPSPIEAPLLVCSVCRHWRAVAIGLPALWTSLDTENICNPALIELWLCRARSSALSLRISPPIELDHRDFFLFAPLQPKDDEFLLTTPRHLDLLLPKIADCRYLEIMGWWMPVGCSHKLASIPQLEGLTARVPRDATAAATFMSQLFAQAPRLTKLKWFGPVVSIPWTQLTHLSLDLSNVDIPHFAQMLESLTDLVNLRLTLNYNGTARFESYAAVHVLPKVTRFSIWGTPLITIPLILPKLDHLIVELTHISDFDQESEFALENLLERSQCSLISLELWGRKLPRLRPSIMTGAAVTHSLARLLISSRDLAVFLKHLEERQPGTLSPHLRFLRSADRTFRIERLAGIDDEASSGEVAALLKLQFPKLLQLELEDRSPDMFYLDENVERARVTINGAFAFTVLRSTRLREEYEKWWNSEDGLEFRAALNDKDAEMLSQFDLPDDFVHRSRPPPHDSQNLYANSERVGYKFV